MKRLVASGKTIEDAVECGLAELGVTRDRVRMTVLEQPSRGLFGLIGAREAKVELEVIPDAAEEAEKFLREVAEAMRISVDIRREDADGTIRFDLSGADLGIVIGRRGQTLDALQFLVNQVANRGEGRRIRVVLDAEGYRARRAEALTALARRMAAKARRLRRKVALEPMNALERRIVHLALADDAHVETYSEGEEPHRRVIIAPRDV